MPAPCGDDDDASKQIVETWTQSWHRLQQEHLDWCMGDFHRFIDEQHVAMQDIMARSFEKHVQQMQPLLRQRYSPDEKVLHIQTDDTDKQMLAPDLQSNHRNERSSEHNLLTKDEVHLLRNKSIASSKSGVRSLHTQSEQVQFKDMIASFRGVVGWKPASQIRKSHVLISAIMLPTDRVQSFFLDLCHSLAFELFTACVVITNTVVIAIDADHALKSSLKTGSYKPFPKIVDMVFLTIFSLELICRIMAKRWHFFHGSDRGWHAFDVLVVGMAAADFFLTTINLSFIRVLRVFRMLRVLRIIRVFKELRELRVMLASIFVSFLTLIWTFVLLALVMFIFCIVLVQGAAYYIVDQDVVPAHIRDGLDAHFPSLGAAMYTMLAVISGGLDWTEVTGFLWDISVLYFGVFIFYILFVSFGVLNVLTAVFVESSAKISRIDSDLVIQAEMDRNESYINQIESLFLELDTDNSGTIDWEEFNQHLKDPRVVAYFTGLQIEVSEAESLFQLLDTGETGSVPIEEFVLGCMRLKGMAKAIDIAMLMYETKKQARTNKHNLATVKAALANVTKEVAANHIAIDRNVQLIHANTLEIHQSMERLSANKRKVSL